MKAREIDSQSRLTRSTSASAACSGMPSADDLLGGAQQRGARHFEAVVAERHEQLQLAHALDVLGVDLAEALVQFLAR